MLDETIARLSDPGLVPALRSVAGAAELAALKSTPPRHQLPAAFVIPLAETAEPNAYATGGVSQRVVAEVGIVLIVSGERADKAGGEAVIAIDAVRRQIRSALIAWAPAEGHAPFEYTAGELMRFADQAVWWQDGFQTDFYLRKG